MAAVAAGPAYRILGKRDPANTGRSDRSDAADQRQHRRHRIGQIIARCSQVPLSENPVRGTGRNRRHEASMRIDPLRVTFFDHAITDKTGSQARTSRSVRANPQANHRHFWLRTPHRKRHTSGSFRPSSNTPRRSDSPQLRRKYAGEAWPRLHPMSQSTRRQSRSSNASVTIAALPYRESPSMPTCSASTALSVSK